MSLTDYQKTKEIEAYFKDVFCVKSAKLDLNDLDKYKIDGVLEMIPEDDDKRKPFYIGHLKKIKP